MLLVTRESQSNYVLNYAWLPAWMGLDAALLERIERSMSERFGGHEVTAEMLHEHVVEFLVGHFSNITGLEPMLEALRGVSIDEDGSAADTG